MQKTNPEELLAAGVHFGHKQWRIHPKSRSYIYKIERKASIIDLFKTTELLDKARELVYKAGQENKNLLVVATKKQSRVEVAQMCETADVFYLTNKWIGGFITNFEEVSKNIKKMRDLKKARDTGEWSELPKHEIVKLEKTLHRIERIYKGVEMLEKLPDIVFIIDIRKEASAVAEAKRRGITTIAIADTNADPTQVDIPVPGNDDALTSIQLLTEKILEAFAAGKSDAEKNKPKEESTEEAK